ncbi:hypothetical protein PROFUN_09001, partial [Planoprotostelium fungivorum]
MIGQRDRGIFTYITVIVRNHRHRLKYFVFFASRALEERKSVAIHILVDFRPAKSLQINSDRQNDLLVNDTDFVAGTGSLQQLVTASVRRIGSVSLDLAKFGAKIDNLWVLQRVLRVHTRRSNGGVVKPSLLFECLAFALSVRVRRKTHLIYSQKKIRNKERRNTNGTRRESDGLDSSDLQGWIVLYLNMLRTLYVLTVRAILKE